MARRPRILFLSQCAPHPPDTGVKVRTLMGIRQLAREFDITAIMFARLNHQPDDAALARACEAMRAEGVRVAGAVRIPSEYSRMRFAADQLRSLATLRPYTWYQYDSRAFSALLSRTLREEQFDLVHVESIDLCRYVPELPGLPIVCGHHNVESDTLRRRADHEALLARPYVLAQARLIERIERRLCPKFALNLMASEVDLERLREIAPGSRTLLVPNAVDTEASTPAGEADRAADRACFMGPSYYYANRDALDFFLADVWPLVRERRRGATFHTIGDCAAEDRARFEAHAGVVVNGRVPDFRPYVREASCMVVPIRTGGGTRLKILDAWALGCPVVSTTIGCEGLEARDGENIIIRDDPRGFADAMLELFGNARLRDSIAYAGRQTVESRYSWQVVGDALLAAYHDLLATRPARTPQGDAMSRRSGTLAG